MIATNKNDLVLVKLIVKNGADINLINKRGNTAKNIAIDNSFTTIKIYLNFVEELQKNT